MKFCGLDVVLSLLLWPTFGGIANGLPIDKNSSERAGTKDNIETFTLFAQDSILDGSSIQKNNDGYTGDGFIDFGGVGSSASWLLDIPITGSYEITIRYASKNNRGPMDLLLDDTKIGMFEIKKVANNWNTWKEETIQVRIDAGSNRILKILANVIQGPNVDKIAIKLLEPSSPGDPLEDFGYKVILYENQCLEKGTFQESDNGRFQVGYEQSGHLVVRSKADLEILWSLEVSERNVPSKICLQEDGNLVIKPMVDRPPCPSLVPGIYERSFRFKFGINNSGRIAIFLDSKNPLWTGGLGSEQHTKPILALTTPPVLIPTISPTYIPTLSPTSGRDITQAPEPSNNHNEDLQYKKVLSQNNYFGKETKNFAQSDSKDFEVGLNENGRFVVRRSREKSDVVWVLKDSNGNDVVGNRLYMQNDGNLVMRDKDRRAIWTSGTAGGKVSSGYSFGINNCGGVAVFHTSNSKKIVWTGGIQQGCGDIATKQPSISAPTRGPATIPPLSPTAKPIPGPSRPTSKAYTVVLASNDRILEREKFVSSPNRNFKVGLNSNGKFVIRSGKNDDEVWTLMDKTGREVSNISRMYMQSDGNLVLKTSSNKGLWNSETSNNRGAELRIDDGGQVSISFQGTYIWIDGLPRKIYSGPSSSDLIFPLRGFFYYAWYPETWTVGGKNVKYRPNLTGIGERQYKSGDPLVAKSHVEALDYGRADISIVSWWGPSDRLDRARITQLLDETTAQGSRLKWTVYYEDEKKFDRTVDQLVADLKYLKEWFAWHESWAHKDGKPMIFIWNESECEVADRWTKAAKKAGWYVVLKLFPKHDECKSQPDSWHQYGASGNYLEYASSFTLAPGFYKANSDKPKKPRLSREEFCAGVDKMNKSNRDWQLIVSFNEWGEGTAVESAVEWESESGYGIYLDCLHDPG